MKEFVFHGLEMVINESRNFWCVTLNWILSLVFRDYLVYGFSVKCKILVFLGYLHTQQVSLMLFLRYISFIHIYSWSWTHGQEKLRLLLEDLNKWHPNIKFTHETNKEDIAFLDLKVKLYWTVKYLQICLLNLQTVTNFSITHLHIQNTPSVQ